MPPKAASIAERLERNSMPEPNSGCVLWLAACDDDGYGLINNTGGSRRAHVVAYEQAHGPLPDGMIACHRCDVRCCINERHIYPGTQADNVADMMRKGRHRVIRGEAHCCAKLTADKVRAIRADTRSLTQIAAEYKIDFSHVGRIKRHEFWRHVK